jgi:hypothetical protein
MKAISFNTWNALTGNRTVFFAGVEMRFYHHPPVTGITFSFRLRHYQTCRISLKNGNPTTQLRYMNIETRSSDENLQHTLDL